MMNNKFGWLAVAAVVIALGVLFYIPRLGKKSDSADVPCLTANLPLIQHIHPVLKIIIDGQQQIVPADLGTKECERAIHTHDATGTIHVEAQDSRQYTLGDFFSVWGEPIKRDGYALTTIVNGQPNAELDALLLKDEQKIELEYTKQ